MKRQSQYSRSAHYPVQKTITRIMKNSLSRSAARVTAKDMWHHGRQDWDQHLKGRLQNRADACMKQARQRQPEQQAVMPEARPEFRPDAMPISRQDAMPKSIQPPRPSFWPSSRPSSQASGHLSGQPSSQDSWQYWLPSKQEMVDFVKRAIMRCRQLHVPLSELTLPCFILVLTFLAPGTASASYEEHLAGEIVSRTHNPLAGQLSGPSSGQFPGQASGSVLSLPDKAHTGRQQGLEAGLEEHGQAHPAKAGVSGKNVPLKKALAMLVPPGWTCTGTFQDPSSAEQGEPGKPGQTQPAVSWKKKEYWHEVLRRTAIEQKVHMTLDWQEKTIVIQKADASMPGFVPGSAKALSSGSDKTHPAKEARPGDPDIISLAPLPDNATASQNLKEAPGELKAGTGSQLTSAKPAGPVGNGLAAKGPAPNSPAVNSQAAAASSIAQPVTAQPGATKGAADPVQDALASARKDSRAQGSSGTSSGSLPHTGPHTASQTHDLPSASSKAPALAPSAAKPAPVSPFSPSPSSQSYGSSASSALSGSSGAYGTASAFSASASAGPAATHAAVAASSHQPGHAQGALQGASGGASQHSSGGVSGGQKPASGRADTAGPSAATARHTAQTQGQAQGQAQAQTLAQPPAPSEYWQIAPGSLRMQLESWSQRKGITLVWKPDTDLELETGALFEGSFEMAVRSLFEGLKITGSPYAARLYHGNNVLIVEDR